MLNVHSRLCRTEGVLTGPIVALLKIHRPQHWRSTFMQTRLLSNRSCRNAGKPCSGTVSPVCTEGLLLLQAFMIDKCRCVYLDHGVLTPLLYLCPCSKDPAQGSADQLPESHSPAPGDSRLLRNPGADPSNSLALDSRLFLAHVSLAGDLPVTPPHAASTGPGRLGKGYLWKNAVAVHTS